ncbi:hypothetical protein [Gordonia sputi]
MNTMTAHERRTKEEIAASRPLDQVIAAIDVGHTMAQMPLTDDDKAAITRIYRGETTIEQERTRILDELAAARWQND